MKATLPARFVYPILLLLLAACTPASPAGGASPESAPIVQGSPPSAPAVPSTVSTLQADSVHLYLRILWPEDGSLISEAEVEVVGEAPPGAVVSINDEILIVPQDGTFRQVILLEEGPNAIEIVASNQEGEEQDLILTVEYEP